MPIGLSMFCENGPTFERQLSGEEQAFHASRHFSDIYLLIEMLSIHCLAVEAAQTFERAVAPRAFGPQSVAMVFEGRLSQYVAKNFQQPDLLVDSETSEQLTAKGDDITSVLGLAETLTLSRDPHFKLYTDDPYILRTLKRLVDCATGTTDASREIDLGFEILVNLVCEKQEVVRPVLSMMREVAELPNFDRAALWHQLCANEDEILRIQKRVMKEKNALTESLKSADAARKRFDEELKRYARRRNMLLSVRRILMGWNPNCRLASKTSITSRLNFRKKCQGMLLCMIHTIQQLKGSPVGSPLVSPHNLAHTRGSYPIAPPPMAVGLLPLDQNRVGIHSNGHVNGEVRPLFDHS
ncbi:PREDICTED: uncharacterized protein LOC100259525 isoform X1 [Olea europaea subsp. europaea]|uniref:PREDICTED: uncharacterized protein LOC100259525 isoform X1 n=1 Tax=Olea europaea subsp. europaea TaxID=158383 RepID=A0A8S0RBR2_OLEEU|nr:PREDICTED: uncharacterized protein LOC100259525 isoform X1 [Olea europaea subsp. europaea]